MTDRLLREPQVKELTGLSRTSRWRMEREGLFPKRRQISPGAVAWLHSEIQDWITGREAVGADNGDTWQPLGAVADRVVYGITGTP